jgi:surface antigen Omp85-like protein
MKNFPKLSVIAGTLTILGCFATAVQPSLAQTYKPIVPPQKTIDAAMDDGSGTQPATNTTADPGTEPPTPGSPGNQGTPRSSMADRFKVFNRPAPIRESWTTVDIGTKYVRGVFGGLEQGASIGVGLQFTTADKLPGVELRATLLTSSKLYRRFEGEAYFPHLFSENTHADVWFDYLRRTKDNFFGIGPRIPNTSGTNYDIERRIYSGSIYHEFDKRFMLGAYVTYANSSTYRGQRDTEIPIDELFSGDPNTIPVSQWAPGLMINTTILRYGAFGEYDVRDNSIGLTKGAYFYGRVGSADGLENRNRFSDYGWFEGEMDARGYVPLGSNKTSLAVRGWALLRDPRGGSQIPFYDMSYLGGRMYVRGFRDYRFRGNSAMLGSAELRQTVWTQQEDRGLDVFAFGDAGQVWGDNRSQTDPAIIANKDFSSSNYRASMGGGIQYRYSKSLAGRVEVGHSHERTLIYFSISRGF